MDIRKWLAGRGRTAEKIKHGSDPTDQLAQQPLPAQAVKPTAKVGEEPVPIPSSSGMMSASLAPVLPQPIAPDDLGDEEPSQVRLEKYPTCDFNGRKRAFCSAWYKNRDWLEYSCKSDAAFCYACRKFSMGSNANSDRAFTHTGYSNWKHTNDSTKGFGKHETSKEHLKCMILWKTKITRRTVGKEISTLVNTEQLGRNRVYVSAIVDIVQFIAVNDLPLQGSLDAVDSMGEKSGGLFLALLEYTLKKDKEFAKEFSTIPRNATYTSHDIQNQVISLMSEIVTEHIVKEIRGTPLQQMERKTQLGVKTFLLY